MKKYVQRFIAQLIAVALMISSLNVSGDIWAASTKEIIEYSEVVVNPLYSSSILEEDIKDYVYYKNETQSAQTYITSVSQAADYVRRKMVDRVANVSVSVRVNYDYKQAVKDIIEYAIAETGREDEGDYLAWQYGGYTSEIKGYTEYTSKNTYYYLTINYSFYYFTTKAQEQEVDRKLDELFMQFDFENTTPVYVKVKTVYDYICENIVYDWDCYYVIDEGIAHSAYAALIKQKAVCQGYACLLYRMLKRAGVDCRYIRSSELSHAWNIIKIGEYYYNVDATWDAQLYGTESQHSYFLRGSNNFSEHTPVNSEYTTSQFKNRYPISLCDYVYDEQNPEIENIVQPAVVNIKYDTVVWPAGPERVKISNVKNVKKRKIRVKLKKISDADGYQIVYSTNKKFKKSTKKKTTSTTVYLKKLKKKKYYIKARAYKVINGKKYYGSYSKVKKIKVTK